ncbi:hypothetical protein IMZ68_01000, partial [Candidatus Bathyarchaeota archaeon]|nr:hypothetical protein [Candidatus Bathyarchaeota archaeon]
MWKQQGALAGIIGGETGQFATLSAPSSAGIANTPSVIYMGRAYATVTKVMQVLINGTYRQQPTSVAECYDLRTGQIYYDIATVDGGITPTHITYWKGVDTSVPGAGESATFGVELNTIGPATNTTTNPITGVTTTITTNRLYKINPLTGAITVNVSIPAFTNAEMFYRDGYYLSYQQTNVSTITNGNVTINRATSGFLVNWT